MNDSSGNGARTVEITHEDSADVLARATEFLFHEADLLDAHAYAEWHALWADPCRYWLPANADDVVPARQVSIVYDDAARLADRVYRLTRPSAYTQEPLTRVCRLVTNISAASEPGSAVRVRSRVLLEAIRRGESTTYTGRMEHVLVPAATGFLISEKKVRLTANNEPLENFSFLF